MGGEEELGIYESSQLGFSSWKNWGVSEQTFFSPTFL